MGTLSIGGRSVTYGPAAVEMRVNGAKELRKRLDEQEHWRQAEAVRDGRQSASDPDAGDVEEIRDGLRLYRQRDEIVTHGGRAPAATRFVKRLVDGWWESGYELDEP